MNALSHVSAGACALLFLAAALGKLDRWQQWSQLSNDIPGPDVLRQVVRVGVPAIEAAIVVLSIGSPTVGLATGTVVLVGFSVAAWVLAPRLHGRECNCFGAVAPAMIGPHLAARNLVLAILVAGGWLAARREHLQAVSFSTVLAIVLFGVTALMLDEFRRLRRAARSISPDT